MDVRTTATLSVMTSRQNKADIARLYLGASTGAPDSQRDRQIFNMSMPDWEENRRIGENPNTILKCVGERHQSQAKRQYLLGAVVVVKHQAPTMHECWRSAAATWTDARYLVVLERVEATDVAWGIIQEVQECWRCW